MSASAPKEPQPIIPTTPPPKPRREADEPDEAPPDPDLPEPARPSRPPRPEERRTKSGRMKIPSRPDPPEVIDHSDASIYGAAWAGSEILYFR
jgi:hypothetical protein